MAPASALIRPPDEDLFRESPEQALHARRIERTIAVASKEVTFGQFLRFDVKTVAGVTRDYVELQLRGEDKLFVPHDQLGKVTRYVGADSRAPTLSRLGGKAWQTLKTRARVAVHRTHSRSVRHCDAPTGPDLGVPGCSLLHCHPPL